MTKRIFDIILAAAGILLFSPVFILVAITVFVSMGSPVLFRQRRPGLNEKPFDLLKFRTMTQATAPDGKLLPDGKRLTPTGLFLRAASLDELPQLFNVLKGDLSLVGPRPLLLHYLPRYSERQRKRHLVRPGITGWAQINGRNAASWEDRLEMDAWYAENRSWLLDCKILFKTFFKVLKREGTMPRGGAEVQEFKGSGMTAKTQRHEEEYI